MQTDSRVLFWLGSDRFYSQPSRLLETDPMCLWRRLGTHSYQWRHVSVMASQHTDISTACSDRMQMDETSKVRNTRFCHSVLNHLNPVRTVNPAENCRQHLSLPWISLSDYISGCDWSHEMETFSALLVLCAGNSPVIGEFPSQRPVTRSFDIFFDLKLKKWLSKQSRGRWFEASLRSLCHSCNVEILPHYHNV